MISCYFVFGAKSDFKLDTDNKVRKIKFEMGFEISINNHFYSVDPSTVPIDTTLNTFIRSHARLTGTKFMCLEGGCGVCLVNITGLKTADGKPRSIAVNSCLWLAYACHGLNVTTIEGIGNHNYGYHPLQFTLFDYNGTQCGYCSPAMVMNMYSLLDANDGKVTMDQVENSFGGNICRCTGYRPILDAFKSLTTDAPIADIEDDRIVCFRRPRKPARYRHASHKLPAHSSGERFYSSLRIPFKDGRIWYRVDSLLQLFDILNDAAKNEKYMLVSGNTAHGVYRREHDIKHFIDINGVSELHKISSRRNKLTIGANVSLSETMDVLKKVAADKFEFVYLKEIAKHLDLVANVAVRNTGSIAGNLSMKHARNEFSSDVFLLLEAVGAQLNILSADGSVLSVSPRHYLSVNMKGKIILSVDLPKLPPNEYVFKSYKIMQRAQNTNAMVNAAFLFEFTTTDSRKAVNSCRICYGNINSKFIHAEKTEHLLTGIDDLYTNQNLQKAIRTLQSELHPDHVKPNSPPEYRRNLAISLFYRFFLNTSPVQRSIRAEFRSGAIAIERPLSSGTQAFETDLSLWPLTQPALKKEGLIQCSGEAEYTNDLFSKYSPSEELWAAFVQTAEFHERIAKIDASKAMTIPGVRAFISAKDIPGKNSFIPFRYINPPGFFSEDEEILVGANSQILYHGQPCGIILANSMALANFAASQVKITYKKVKGQKPMATDDLISILDSLKSTNDQASSANALDAEPTTGRIEIVGKSEIGTQYHHTMEPQSAFCLPADDGGLEIYVSTHWIDFIQIAVSECLKIPENKLKIITKRVGGGYGAKLSRSSLIACACALSSYLSGKPVRFVMTIEAMMSICTRRYPCANEYQLSCDSETGKIQKLNNMYVQDYGCSLNESVIEQLLEASFANGYVSTRWEIDGKELITNTPCSGWCRAPSSTEGIAMIETMMEHIAHKTQIDAVQVRLANMADRSLWKSLMRDIATDIDYYGRKRKATAFNAKNRWRKRGVGFAQMQFPIDYYGAFSAYVAIYYADGSVVVSHGGIEMGQGINTKVAQIAAFTLGIPLDLVEVKATNSETSANSIATGGTVATDSVCLGTKKACEILMERIKPIRSRLPDTATWQQIVVACHQNFVDLTARYQFIPSDAKPYFVYGCCCAEVEWDALTGNLQILRVDLIEDTGRSMSPLVDVGQVEGAFVMGLGYWLNEKYVYDQRTGELLTNRTWNYKTPGAKDIPIDFRVKFIETDNTNNRIGVLRSKATGEPALCLSIAVVFALRQALQSVLKDNGQPDVFLQLGSGLTPDVLCAAAPVKIADFLLE